MFETCGRGQSGSESYPDPITPSTPCVDRLGRDKTSLDAFVNTGAGWETLKVPLLGILKRSGTFTSQTPTCSFSVRDFSREGVKVPADTRARFAIKRERDDRGEIQSEVVINVPEQLFIP
ncbi:hypothetical protein KOW79_004811 [Hemibagrus wyckioides]|uniref:Uncharacterized protein n=1 Tax=Hemibagrus wyckioides TaxID=337641 RepID=A0A9D3P1K3_9TELE|nr:hypothetical protein KOW79_004811 [Hemibagrus wyckioides]